MAEQWGEMPFAGGAEGDLIQVEDPFDMEAARQRAMDAELYEADIFESLHRYIEAIERKTQREVFNEEAKGKDRRTHVFNREGAKAEKIFKKELIDLGLRKIDGDLEGREAWISVYTLLSEVYPFFAKLYPASSLNSQRRFFIITLSYGIDRAIQSVQRRDDLWRTGRGVRDDLLFRERYALRNDELNQKLDETRDFYYGYLRADHFDPRVDGGGEQPMDQQQQPPFQPPQQEAGAGAQANAPQDAPQQQGPQQPFQFGAGAGQGGFFGFDQMGPAGLPEPLIPMQAQAQQGQPPQGGAQGPQQPQQQQPPAAHQQAHQQPGGQGMGPQVDPNPPPPPPPMIQQPQVPQPAGAQHQQQGFQDQGQGFQGQQWQQGGGPAQAPPQPQPPFQQQQQQQQNPGAGFRNAPQRAQEPVFDLRMATEARLLPARGPGPYQVQVAPPQVANPIPRIADAPPLMNQGGPRVQMGQDPGPRRPVHQQMGQQQIQQSQQQYPGTAQGGPLDLTRRVTFAQDLSRRVHAQQGPAGHQQQPFDFSTSRRRDLPVRYAKTIDPYDGREYYTGLEVDQDEPRSFYLEEEDSSEGEEGFQVPFKKAGQVYEPSPYGFPRRIRKEIHRENRGRHPFDATMRTFDHFGVPANDPVVGVALASASAITDGMGRLMRNKSEKREYKVEVEKPPPTNQNLKTDSFDYNVFETDPYKILGERFHRTRFESEGARQAAMRAVFQRVIDDPLTSEQTKQVALDSIGQFDIPRQHGNDTRSSAIAAAKLITTGTYSGHFTHDDYTGILIPPPVLGNNSSFGPNVLKNLYAGMGFTMDQKYSVSDSKGSSLKTFLPPLAASITSNGLNEQAAYSLLTSILKDEVQEQVRNAYYEDKIPFEETWITLQKTAPRFSSSVELIKELNSLFEGKPASVEAVLSRIQYIRTKMCEDYPDPEQRKLFGAQLAIRDFRNLYHKFYPSQASIIDTIFKTKKQAQALERQQSLLEGRTQKPFRPTSDVNMLKEVICSILSGPEAISEGPSFLFGGAATTRGEEPGTKNSRKVDIKTLEVSSVNTESSPAGSGSAAEAPPQQQQAQPQQPFTQGQQYQGSSRGSRGSRGGGRGRFGGFQGAAPAGVAAPTPILHPTVPYPQISYFAGVNPGVPAQAVVNQGAVDQSRQQVVMNQAQAALAPGMGFQAPQQQHFLPRPPSNRTLFGGAAPNYQGAERRTIPQVCFDQLKGLCFHCTSAEHWAPNCPLYPGLFPIERICPTCGGCHPKECRAGQAPPAQPQQQQTAQQGPSQQREYGPRINEANYDFKRPFNNGFGRGRGGSYGRGGGFNRFGGNGGIRRFNNPNQFGQRGFQQQQPYYNNYNQQNGVQNQMMGQAAFNQNQGGFQQQQQPQAMMQQQIPQAQQIPQQPQMNQQVQNPAAQVHAPRVGALGNGGSQPIPDNIYMNPMGVQALPQAN